MPLLLTSTGLSTTAVINQLEKMYPLNEQTKVAIITTASPQKADNRFALKAKQDFQKLGVSEKRIRFFDFDQDDADELRNFELIYISGGNPYYLLQAMNQVPAIKEIFQQILQRSGVIIGVSAGALVLGPDIELVHLFTPQMNEWLTDFSALHLTNQYIFPHYDRSDLFGAEIESRIQLFEQQKEISVQRLKDTDYFVVAD